MTRFRVAWDLCRVPLRVRILTILVDLLAVLAAFVVAREGIRDGLGGPGAGEHLLLAGTLSLLFVTHVELALRSGLLRRRSAELRFCDLCSVWTFVAALLLPPALAVTMAVPSLLHLYLRVRRPNGVPLHREVYSAAAVVLAIVAVAGVRGLTGVGEDYQSLLGVLTVVLCLAAYAATTVLLVSVAIRLSRPESRWRTILRGGEIRLELATLSLGGLVAAVAVPAGWPSVVLLFLPLVLLERTTMVAELERRVRTDVKTGLLTAETWQKLVGEEYEAAGRPGPPAWFGMLLLDLDHFKSVNDRYGHLAGDAVLGAVGEVIAAEVRASDLAGRFGGEEFVVCLTDLPGSDPARSTAVRDTAERVRRRVEALRPGVVTGYGETAIGGLSVSVGAATGRAPDTDPATLLARADRALYAAKRAGRNRVRVHGVDPEHDGALGPS